MWSISELKQRGKAAFKNNYWRCVVVGLILSSLTAGSTMTGSTGSVKNFDASKYDNETLIAIVAFVASIILIFAVVFTLVRILLLNPIEIGCQTFLKENINEKAALDRLTSAFGDYKRSVITLFLRDLYLALWFCLIIPGFVKSYSYKMVPFIMADEPDLSPNEVITKSRQMMNGHKWRAFVMELSFIGWILLALFTCGLVGVFYTNPYMYSTTAALYLELRDKNTAEAQ